jgi:hypothetical protein
MTGAAKNSMTVRINLQNFIEIVTNFHKITLLPNPDKCIARARLLHPKCVKFIGGWGFARRTIEGA